MTLIAHWKLDENDPDAASAADSSGHINDHALTNVQEQSTSGWFNNRRRNQDSAYLSAVLNNADFLLTGDDMTVMAWIKPIGSDAFEWIVGCGNETSEAQADNVLWGLVRSPTNTFGMRWEQGAGVNVTALAPNGVLLGRPYDGIGVHICCVRSNGGADVKFIVDGYDLSADVTGLTVADGGANALTEIGRRPGNNSEELNADVWNVRVYDTAESVGNVAAVYAAELAEAERISAEFGISNLPTQVGPSGVLYLPSHTGSDLDPIERPNSGFASVAP